tara:strand:+ start:23 stop:1570 length:1548 start_codon:yes stop_codon:yes gene_type:complete
VSNLSDLLPSGGGSKSAEFVASGTLPNGTPVILNSNGTVTAVGLSSQSVPIEVPTGTKTSFETIEIKSSDVNWDGDTGHFIVVWQKSASAAADRYGAAKVGTVVGNVITYGSTYVFSSNYSADVKIAIDPNTAGKFVIAWSGSPSGSRVPRAIIGTYTGTGASASMSFGTEFIIENVATGTSNIAITYDKNTAGRFVYMYQATGSSSIGRGVCGNIASGATTATMGSIVTWSATTVAFVESIGYDKTADKFITSYRDSSASNALSAIVGTISSTNTLTFGTRTTSSITGMSESYIAVDPLRTNSSVIAYRIGAVPQALVATLSGTAVSFGTPVTFSTGDTYNLAVMMGSGTQDVGGLFYVSDYGPTGVYTIKARSLTVSGTSISYGTEYTMQTNTDAYHTSAEFNPAQSGQFVATYNDPNSPAAGNSRLGQLLVGSQQATNLTTTNFVGMPDESYASGATATVVAKGGVSLNQTSLTIGTTYYVQDNGSLGTSAGTVNVEAGRAISATSILLKGK